MEQMKLKVLSKEGHTRMASNPSENTWMVFDGEYNEGDRIVLELMEAPGYCVVQLEDSLNPALVYVAGREMSYRIPFGEDRIVFSPKSFTGSKHLIQARMAAGEEIVARRCLSFNPYDQHGDNGFFPHSSANVETRGEAVFASYNAIDGIYANSSHGEWPYQSWGINRDPEAEIKIDFGRPVMIDEIRLTLRADFPHDNYWQKAAICFSDLSEVTVELCKTAATQSFPIEKRTASWAVLKKLIPSDEPSPFPALTQLELWGTESL